MPLSADQVRALVIEKLDACDMEDLNHWMFAGILLGEFGEASVTDIMTEEIPRRSHAVQLYWLGECNCAGHLN